MSAKELFDREFYERYRQKGGIYVIPVEIFQVLLIDQEKLLEENEELKKQLEKDKNKYIKKVEKLLANDIEPDSEDFYLAEIEGKSNDYDKLLNCQKEFKKWLEDKINFYKNRNSYMVSDIHGNYDLNQIELEFFEEVVKNYKEIIGNDTNFGSKGGNKDE